MNPDNKFFNKTNEIINDFNVIKSALFYQINIETIQNFKNIISEIHYFFEKGARSENKEEIKASIHKLNIHENYLTEKYRDTKEEREYMKIVNDAINYLQNKLENN